MKNEHGQPVGFGIGQGTKKERIDQTEDCGIDANSQRKREGDCQNKAGILLQLPQREANVVDEALALDLRAISLSTLNARPITVYPTGCMKFNSVVGVNCSDDRVRNRKRVSAIEHPHSGRR